MEAALHAVFRRKQSEGAMNIECSWSTSLIIDFSGADYSFAAAAAANSHAGIPNCHEMLLSRANTQVGGRVNRATASRLTGDKNAASASFVLPTFTPKSAPRPPLPPLLPPSKRQCCCQRC